MSQRKIAKRCGFVAAAGAISAMGLLAVPAPMQAEPMFPLAPACDKWTYPTQSFLLTQDNGIVAALYLREDKFFNGPASHTVAGKPDVTGGSVVGNLDGRTVDFNVDWLNGTTNRYIGYIADDGFARGHTQNNKGSRNDWQSQLSFKCATPPEQDFPPVVTIPKGPVTAAPATTTAKPPPATPKATVIADVDVFDGPDGVGTETGIFLRTGRVLDLVEPCRRDWCHLVIPEAPGGQGWVFQPGFLQVS